MENTHPVYKILTNKEELAIGLQLIVISPDGTESRLATANPEQHRTGRVQDNGPEMAYNFLLAQWNDWTHNTNRFDGYGHRIEVAQGDY